MKKCLITAYITNFAVFSGENNIGYTIINRKMNIKLSRTSLLQVLSSYPKYIICSELFQKSANFCQVAMPVDYSMIEQLISADFLKALNLSD